jgi:hypothetical protein
MLVLDVLDRVLDKGVVIDPWMRSMDPINLETIRVRVLVVSIETIPDAVTHAVL